MVIHQYEIYWVDLEPTKGSEIKKIRPCLVISPNVMNKNLNTILIAPLTSTITKYPFRVNCIVNEKKGQISLDHIRSVDKSRIRNKIGLLEDKYVVLLKNKIKEILVD